MELQQNSSARLSGQKEKLVAPYCLSRTRKRLAVYLVRTLQRTIGIVQLHHGIGPARKAMVMKTIFVSSPGIGKKSYLSATTRPASPPAMVARVWRASPARASCKVK